MVIMHPGAFPDTYFPDRYWIDDYWAIYSLKLIRGIITYSDIDKGIITYSDIDKGIITYI